MPPRLVCYASQMTRATSINDNLINKRGTFDDLMELSTTEAAAMEKSDTAEIISDQQDGRRRPCERYIVFVSFSTKSRNIGIAANFSIFNKYQLMYFI